MQKFYYQFRLGLKLNFSLSLLFYPLSHMHLCDREFLIRDSSTSTLMPCIYINIIYVLAHKKSISYVLGSQKALIFIQKKIK